jgi:hypothetical protein
VPLPGRGASCPTRPSPSTATSAAGSTNCSVTTSEASRTSGSRWSGPETSLQLSGWAWSFAEDFRLLQDIGWSEHDPRESFELTMPPHDLMELLQRLHGEAVGALVEPSAEAQVSREDAETKADSSSATRPARGCWPSSAVPGMVGQMAFASRTRSMSRSRLYEYWDYGLLGWAENRRIPVNVLRRTRRSSRLRRQPAARQDQDPRRLQERKRNARTYDEARRIKRESETDRDRGELQERTTIMFRRYPDEWVERYRDRAGGVSARTPATNTGG